MKKELETSNETLNKLCEKLTAAREAHAAAESSARADAFSAHTGDAKARQELDGLNAKATALALEIVSLEAAIAEGKRRVDAAVAAEVDEADREKARHALALLDDFSRRGEALDKALSKFVGEYGELVSDFRQVEALGYPPATLALVRINMRAATASKLMFGDLQQSFLAPHERRSFIDVIDGWSRQIRARAAARLERNARAKAA
jgi:hypothetical protein